MAGRKSTWRLRYEALEQEYDNVIRTVRRERNSIVDKQCKVRRGKSKELTRASKREGKIEGIELGINAFNRVLGE